MRNLRFWFNRYVDKTIFLSGSARSLFQWWCIVLNGFTKFFVAIWSNFRFQELDLSIGAVALNKTSPAALEDRWTMQLETALGGLLRPPPSRQHHRRYPQMSEEARAYATKWVKHTGGGYIRLKRARLAGMLMIVYISIRMFAHANASELAIQLVPTGVFNVMVRTQFPSYA